MKFEQSVKWSSPVDMETSLGQGHTIATPITARPNAFQRPCPLTPWNAPFLDLPNSRITIGNCQTITRLAI